MESRTAARTMILRPGLHPRCSANWKQMTCGGSRTEAALPASAALEWKYRFTRIREEIARSIRSALRQFRWRAGALELMRKTRTRLLGCGLTDSRVSLSPLRKTLFHARARARAGAGFARATRTGAGCARRRLGLGHVRESVFRRMQRGRVKPELELHLVLVHSLFLQVSNDGILPR